MQKRLARKLDLEIFLSNIKPHPTPNPNLEQYTISSSVAAQMLYTAAYMYGDIVDKTVLDLGCGTGRLALGAAFLGAKEVVGVDIDRTAVQAAAENSTNAGLKDKVQWVATDIDAICGQFDTVLQNPPFGVQKRGADRKFLEKGLGSGKVVYSLHKGASSNETLARRPKIHRDAAPRFSSSPFLKSFIENHGGKIRAVCPMVMTIPHMFPFHEKRRHDFVVYLYVIEKK